MPRTRPRLLLISLRGLAAAGVLATATLLAACGDPDPRAPATVAMAERLAELSRAAEAGGHAYAMSQGASPGEEAGSGDGAGFPARARAVRRALRDGRFAEAFPALEELLRDIAAADPAPSPALRLAVVETLGLAHLRAWVALNCVEPSPALACTLPPAGTPDGRDQAAAAFRVYRSLLEGLPENLTLRWLATLSATLADLSPDSLPAGLGIPVALLEDEGGGIPRFPDVAAELGVDVPGHAGGVVMEDLDNDGDLDLVASSWHLTDPLRAFRNDGAAGFTDVTRTAGLEGITGGLNLAPADYDNDGWMDILVLRGAWTASGEPNSLLRNRGDGTFEDVTEAAGLLDRHATQVGAWSDVDGDGWLDLFVGNENNGPAAAPAQLFRNRGDGTFEDVAGRWGADLSGFIKGAAWGDVDNDGRPDLYVSRLDGENTLLQNLGPGPDGEIRFRDITAAAGVAGPEASFPTWFWDYDNDGWLDLFVSGYRGSPGDLAAEYLGLPHQGVTPRLYRNRGDGRFQDVTGPAGLDRVLLTMGANFGDLDGDGFLDFYAGTGEANLETVIPNRIFRNDGGETFREVTVSGGFGHLGKGHGVAFGDVDGDGDEDLYAVQGGAYPVDRARNVLFRNPGTGGGWISLTLEGTDSNRSAIGARVELVLRTASGETRRIHRRVSGGSSFGANSLALEVGLGDAVAVPSVTVRWPSGRLERFQDVAPGGRYAVREGDGALRPVGSGPGS